MKKLASLLMALVMVFTMAPAVFAEDESVVLLDTTAVVTDAFWGVSYDATAPADGNVTITFDDTTELEPQYLVVIDGDDENAERINASEKGYSYTYMVSKGDSIYVEICLLSGGQYVTGEIDFTLVYTPVAASTETETITGTASFETSATARNGKVIEYTVPSAGTVTINLTPYDEIYVEYKVAVGTSEHWYCTFDGDPTTQTVDVTRGDLVTLVICTLSNTDTYAAGTVDYEIIFTPSGTESGGGDEGGGEENDNALKLGDNNIEIVSGDQQSVNYTFVPEEDGLLTLSVPSLTMISPNDGATDVSDNIGNYLGSAVVLFVNDVAYTEPVSVTAGETVTIYLYQNRMYYNQSFAWNAVLNLALGSSEEKPNVTYGDVNGDGKINTVDASLVRRYTVKLIGEDEIDLAAADVNGDGKVNTVDASLIRRYTVKLIDKFPVEG